MLHKSVHFDKQLPHPKATSMEAPPQPPPSLPTAPHSTDAPPLQQPPQQQQQPPPSLPLPSSSPIPNPNSNPNPNPNPNPIPNSNPPNLLPSLPPQPNRPQQFNRPWSQPSQFSHFPPQFSTAPSPSPPQRGGIAIGVPATPPPLPPTASVSSQPTSFSPSFVGSQYAGIPRGNPINVPDPTAPSSAPCSAPARPPMHGMSNMGMMMVSHIRPGGVPPSAVHQQRPVQAAPGIRPQNASNNLPPVPQNFQGPGLLRGSSVATPSSSTPSTLQNQSSPHQPWLSTASHGRPPLPSQSFRPQANSQALQQRSHIPQQTPQPMPATSQPQQLSSSQQQQLSSSQQQQQPFPASNQSQENQGQQLPSSRVPQPSANQQQIMRGPGSGNQRPPSPVVAQPSSTLPNPTDKPVGVEATESCNRILSKRNIQELVNQIDPSEKLDPEVEDVLVDIAEDFIDSVTTFGCSLAKHRKSNTLEAKDILLHLERTWNIALPGFTGDEIKTYKKPAVNDTHRERLAVVKKSIAASESVNNKSSAGAAAGNVKGHLAKSNPNVVG